MKDIYDTKKTSRKIINCSEESMWGIDVAGNFMYVINSQTKDGVTFKGIFKIMLDDESKKDDDGLIIKISEEVVGSKINIAPDNYLQVYNREG